MSKRSLSEIAYSTYFIPGIEIPDDIIDQALKEVGIDPKNTIERMRFKNLVKTSHELSLQDQLASLGKFADEARRVCGESATPEELIQYAIELEQESESDN
jgi:hypothetical protein